MRKIGISRFIFLLVAFTVIFSGTLVFAKPRQEPPPNVEARIGTLYLFQKTADVALGRSYRMAPGGI